MYIRAFFNMLYYIISVEENSSMGMDMLKLFILIFMTLSCFITSLFFMRHVNFFDMICLIIWGHVVFVYTLFSTRVLIFSTEFENMSWMEYLNLEFHELIPCLGYLANSAIGELAPSMNDSLPLVSSGVHCLYYFNPMFLESLHPSFDHSILNSSLFMNYSNSDSSLSLVSQISSNFRTELYIPGNNSFLEIYEFRNSTMSFSLVRRY